MFYALIILAALCVALGALWRISAARLSTAQAERDQAAKNVTAEQTRTALAQRDAQQARRQASELADALERHQATRRRISKQEVVTREAAAEARGKLKPDDASAAAAAAAINRARGRS